MSLLSFFAWFIYLPKILRNPEINNDDENDKRK